MWIVEPIKERPTNDDHTVCNPTHLGKGKGKEIEDSEVVFRSASINNNITSRFSSISFGIVQKKRFKLCLYPNPKTYNDNKITGN